MGRTLRSLVLAAWTLLGSAGISGVSACGEGKVPPAQTSTEFLCRNDSECHDGRNCQKYLEETTDTWIWECMYPDDPRAQNHPTDDDSDGATYPDSDSEGGVIGSISGETALMDFPEGKIAFVSAGGSINLMCSDGSQLRTLLEGEEFISYSFPVLSPNGRRIAYTAKIGEGSETRYTLLVSDLDNLSRPAINLTDRLADTPNPEDGIYYYSYNSRHSWSPDSRTIAFTGQVYEEWCEDTFEGSEGECYGGYDHFYIFLIDVDTQELVGDRSPTYGVNSSFSPDGRVIFSDGGRIYSWDTSSGEFTPLTTPILDAEGNRASQDQNPVLNADGTLMAYESDRPPVDGLYLPDIFVLDLESREQTQITSNRGNYPSWSPYSLSQFVYRCFLEDGTKHLCTADLSDGSISLLPTGGFESPSMPSWSR